MRLATSFICKGSLHVCYLSHLCFIERNLLVDYLIQSQLDVMSSAVDLLVIEDSCFSYFTLLQVALTVHLNKVVLLQEPFNGCTFIYINRNTIHYKHFQLDWIMNPLRFAEVKDSSLLIFFFINVFLYRQILEKKRVKYGTNTVYISLVRHILSTFQYFRCQKQFIYSAHILYHIIISTIDNLHSCNISDEKFDLSNVDLLGF